MATMIFIDQEGYYISPHTKIPDHSILSEDWDDKSAVLLLQERHKRVSQQNFHRFYNYGNKFQRFFRFIWFFGRNITTPDESELKITGKLWDYAPYLQGHMFDLLKVMDKIRKSEKHMQMISEVLYESCYFKEFQSINDDLINLLVSRLKKVLIVIQELYLMNNLSLKPRAVDNKNFTTASNLFSTNFNVGVDLLQFTYLEDIETIIDGIINDSKNLSDNLKEELKSDDFKKENLKDILEYYSISALIQLAIDHGKVVNTAFENEIFKRRGKNVNGIDLQGSYKIGYEEFKVGQRLVNNGVGYVSTSNFIEDYKKRNIAPAVSIAKNMKSKIRKSEIELRALIYKLENIGNTVIGGFPKDSSEDSFFEPFKDDDTLVLQIGNNPEDKIKLGSQLFEDYNSLLGKIKEKSTENSLNYKFKIIIAPPSESEIGNAKGIAWQDIMNYVNVAGVSGDIKNYFGKVHIFFECQEKFKIIGNKSGLLKWLNLECWSTINKESTPNSKFDELYEKHKKHYLDQGLSEEVSHNNALEIVPLKNCIHIGPLEPNMIKDVQNKELKSFFEKKLKNHLHRIFDGIGFKITEKNLFNFREAEEASENNADTNSTGTVNTTSTTNSPQVPPQGAPQGAPQRAARANGGWNAL